MPKDTYPKFRVAAVQAAPAFLNRDATLEKLAALTEEAANKGAELVVFGESFLPAFPVWNLLYPPIDQHRFFRQLFDNAIEVPGPYTRQLGEVARRHGVFLSVGVTEKSPLSMGTMWNANLLFDRAGRLINHRRKLVPTWAEKLTWAGGDGAGLQAVATELGRLGVLICGENTNTLARFTLLAQGEQVHIATYPPAWPAYRPRADRSYNLADAIRLRAAAHAFEGKVFSIVASCALDADAVGQICRGNPEMEEILARSSPPVSLVVGPDGQPMGEPLVGREGILLAEVDLSLGIELKQIHDIVGSYNRFDIFRLEFNPAPNRPLWVKEAEASSQLEGLFRKLSEVERQVERLREELKKAVPAPFSGA